MTAIEFHILNSYDPVFYHHRGLTSQSDLLSDFQSGFRKKHSTDTALFYLTDYILERMDRQMITGAVFIDLKKAFDLVDHKCLLFKLEHYGVRGSSLDWFRNYLTTRTQRVQFGNDMSSTRAICFGVAQGSLLGPLLFYVCRWYCNIFYESLHLGDN